MNYWFRPFPPNRVGRGNVKGHMRRIHVAFDPETFEQLRRRALECGRSLSEEVRVTVEWGLESEK